ncbi:MAG: hypothetical protein KDD66_13285 [Bdellovibrionales bacterium]|nr:hypothetical protein [Bdellovibrionales bacterium]
MLLIILCALSITASAAGLSIRRSLKPDLQSCYLALLGAICSISSISIAALELSSFNTASLILSQAAVLLVIVLFRLVLNSPPILRRSKPNLRGAVPLLLILAAAAALRMPASNYAFGGQDQGIYVNTGNHIAREGKISLTDPMFAVLGGDAAVGEHYLKYNYNWAKKDDNGRWSGVMLPGIYVSDLDRAELVPQFYHLHSLWIAVCSLMLGQEYAVAFLPLFGVLLVCAIYLLTQALVLDRLTALMAALLAAINPALCYFSRLPVSETTAGLFFVSALLFYIQSGGSSRRLLLMSAWCFGALFFTRITGFVFVPIALSILLYRIALTKNQVLRLNLFVYGFAVLLLFGLSFLHGVLLSFPYTTEIYRINLGYSGSLYSLLFVGIPIAAVLYLVSAALIVRFSSQLRRAAVPFAKHRRGIAAACILSYLAVTAVLGWKLAFSDAYLGDTWLDKRWHIAGGGLSGLRRFNFFVIARIITIAGLIAMLFGAVRVMSRSAYSSRFMALSAFFSAFLVLLTLKKHSTPYLYYYGRYLVSEVVPLALVLASIGFATTAKLIKRSAPRRAAIAIIGILMLAPSALYAVRQSQATEYEEVYAAIKSIDGTLSKDAVVLIDKRRIPSVQVATTLRLTFGRPTFIIDWPSLHSQGLRNLCRYLESKGLEVFLVSSQGGWARSKIFRKSGETELVITELKRTLNDGLPGDFNTITNKIGVYRYSPPEDSVTGG